MKNFHLTSVKKGNSRGFTLVELMIATAVFSVVLLLCATAIVQIGQMFYKGTIINRTQSTTRSVVDDITQAVQFGSSIQDPVPTQNKTYTSGGNNFTVTSLCLGEIRYSYVLSTSATANWSLGAASGTQIPHILWKDRLGKTGCATSASVPNLSSSSLSGGQELLGGDMRLAAFSVVHNPSEVYTINLTIAYGATRDLFAGSSSAPDFSHCTSSRLGGQFCAVSTITTYVVRRL